jgi:hypothetical protein
MVASSDVELELGDSRLVVVQRLGDCLRITTARRIKRNLTPALVLGGTVLLPIEHLDELHAALARVARIHPKS